MSLTEIKMAALRKVSQVRNFNTMLNRYDVEVLWERSDEKARKQLAEIVAKGDREALVEWMENHPSKAIEERSMKQLRNMARQRGIIGWSRMTKAQLIRELL